MIRAIIIDDELKSRSILSKILKKYCPNVDLVGQADSVVMGLKVVKETKPDLLLLDIEMPYENGFELLKQLPNPNCEVIFITGFDHYAIKAIKFHALDYLMKPVDISELIFAVNKAKESIEAKLDNIRLQQLVKNLNIEEYADHQIAIPTPEGRVYLTIADIIKCTADGIYTHFNLIGNKRLISSQNLGEYEKMLPGFSTNSKHRFFRVHHSHLVNLYYLKKVNRRDNRILLEGDFSIPIAQRRKSEFLSIIK